MVILSQHFAEIHLIDFRRGWLVGREYSGAKAKSNTRSDPCRRTTTAMIVSSSYAESKTSMNKPNDPSDNVVSTRRARSN